MPKYNVILLLMCCIYKVYLQVEESKLLHILTDLFCIWFPFKSHMDVYFPLYGIKEVI